MEEIKIVNTNKEDKAVKQPTCTYVAQNIQFNIILWQGYLA